MARVLLVGIDADQVDYTDPSLPPGMNADVVRRGIARALDELRAAGHDPAHLYIPADPADLGGLAAALTHDAVSCVVIGGGVRLPPRNLALFEAVLNVIARCHPAPAIALLSRPEEAPLAAARALRLHAPVADRQG